jgi:superfamily II DNA/RNA helicase
LGEDDAQFRRGIVSSPETLNTIIDCSIRELYALRKQTNDKKHKIIASALNYDHCIQITGAYKARGLRAEYIHSHEDSETNERILEKLDAHQLDVIVQVRMLGEGFDHPYLSVAAVCSIFSNLTPFVQFVGRIMRVIDQKTILSPSNQGIVIFHAGTNIARRWQDFQEFSQADQKYFDELLPVEEVLDFSNTDEIECSPGIHSQSNEKVDIVEQEEVYIEELELYKNDIEVQQALKILESKGLKVLLQPRQVSGQKQRIASQNALDKRVKNHAGRLLNQYGINPAGKDLDKKTHAKTNFVFVKSLIDKKINVFLNIKNAQRGELSLEQLESVEKELKSIIQDVEREIFNVSI